MKKWLFIIFGVGFVLVAGFLFAAYKFLDVPFDAARNEKIVKEIEVIWKNQDKESESSLAQLAAFQSDFDKSLAVKPEGVGATLQSLRESPLVARPTLAAEDLAKIKILLSSSQGEFTALVDILKNADTFVSRAWSDSLDPRSVSRPDSAQIRNAFDTSLVYAQILSLKGEWVALSELTLAQIKFASDLIAVPSCSYSVLGLTLKSDLLALWKPLLAILPDDSLEPLNWPQIKSGFDSLIAQNISVADIIGYEIHDFDAMTSVFGDKILTEFHQQGIKVPPALTKILYIRDRKIGLNRLGDLSEQIKLAKDSEAIKALLQKADQQKMTRYTPLSRTFKKTFTEIFDQIQQDETADQAFATFMNGTRETQVATASGVKIPLSLFELYTNEEILALKPAENIDITFPMSDLAPLVELTTQPLFQSDIFDSFKLNDQARGVYLHQITPGSFYERIGLQVGDIVIGIDAVLVDSLNYAEIITKFNANNILSLNVIRQNKPLLYLIRAQ